MQFGLPSAFVARTDSRRCLPFLVNRWNTSSVLKTFHRGRIEDVQVTSRYITLYYLHFLLTELCAPLYGASDLLCSLLFRLRLYWQLFGHRD